MQDNYFIIIKFCMYAFILVAIATFGDSNTAEPTPLVMQTALQQSSPSDPYFQSQAHISGNPKEENSRYTGSAFSLSRDGSWLTATHVLKGCKRAYAELQKSRGGRFRYKSILSWQPVTGTDVGVMKTQGGTAGLHLAKTAPRDGESGFFYGFPAGQANAGYAVKFGNVNMIRFQGLEREAADVWTIYDFHPAKTIHLGGNSGGPMLNKYGEVVGVISAGNDRRGRVFTSMIPRIASLNDFSYAEFSPKDTLTQDNYVKFGRKLRHNEIVIRVNCRT